MKVLQAKVDSSISFQFNQGRTKELGGCVVLDLNGARIVLLTLSPVVPLLYQLRFCSYSGLCMLLMSDAGSAHCKERNGRRQYTLFFSYVRRLWTENSTVRTYLSNTQILLHNVIRYHEREKMEPETSFRFAVQPCYKSLDLAGFCIQHPTCHTQCKLSSGHGS